MKFNLIHIVILACFGIFFQACKKDEKEEFPPEPKLTFISVNPTKVLNFDNDVEIVIKYEDNNGDLGFLNPDIYSLQVKDSRLDSADWYHVPPLAPEGSDIIIEGELKVNISNLFILGNGEFELTDFSLKIMDRAGNWSNVVVTPTITIQK